MPLVLSREKRRKTVLGRLGWPAFGGRRPRSDAPVWMHALSVGEMVSAVPLVAALRRGYPRIPIVVSAATLTGYQTASVRFDGSPVDLRYFPYDFLFSVRAAYRQLRPRTVVLVESDIWPNHVLEAVRRQVPIFLVNARLSERSTAGYRRFKGLFQPVWRGFTAICCQSAPDARRFRQLGADGRRLHVAGNLKFDQPPPVLSGTDRADLRAMIGWSPGQQVLLAGSTHDGEERLLLTAYKRLLRDHVSLLLVLAPRDPHRATAVRQYCREMGLTSAMVSVVSSGRAEAGHDAAIVDRIGILARLYAVADVAFIGGSLVAAGGHNPLEPAAFGKPVLFGPDMRDFQVIADGLVAQGGAFQVSGVEDITQRVAWLLASDAHRRAGGAARRVFLRHRGAADRIMATLQPVLDGDAATSAPPPEIP